VKRPIVAKVGGSLLDLPDLRERLQAWVTQQDERSILLVPGGGQAANVIRRMDAIHQLGEEKSHWLAIRMLSVNAHFLSDLLHLSVVSSPQLHFGEGGEMKVAILDPYPFCKDDGILEHSWRVTSDSIAARIAIEHGADLTLLKSVELLAETTWQAAAESGLVDDVFPGLVEKSGLNVTWVNLRRLEVKPRQ